MKFLIRTLTVLSLFPTPALANSFGLGIVIGDPTGITAKYIFQKDRAVDGAVSFFGDDELYLHGTYLWLMPKVFDINRYPVSWYYGLGVRVVSHDHGHHHHGPFGHHHHGHHDDTHFGARAPIGLRMNFHDPRIEIFGEISMAMNLIPGMDVDLDFGLGARYFF